ncbi:hypothetical protein AVEN_94341-1 [Araneus ventricosus]|uniref:DUF4371 domain-containing protein n=1 Tax=Araneus ventricosus TaxID=182803 RepID=A0A4Y2EDG8_ARAVE|nr:hypothetical protein AVEN_94341-1 [Araneus ventricosus]
MINVPKSYISAETQNSIIEEIGELLQEQIVKEVALADFGDPPDGSIDVRESVYIYKENIVREHLTDPQHYPDNGLVSGTRSEVPRNQEEVKEVAKAEFFGILVDDCKDGTDCFVEEQLSISLRYILDRKLFEIFFGFVKIIDGTALNIANVILRELEKKGVDKTKMRGQGYY